MGICGIFGELYQPYITQTFLAKVPIQLYQENFIRSSPQDYSRSSSFLFFCIKKVEKFSTRPASVRLTIQTISIRTCDRVYWLPKAILRDAPMPLRISAMDLGTDALASETARRCSGWELKVDWWIPARPMLYGMVCDCLTQKVSGWGHIQRGMKTSL